VAASAGAQQRLSGGGRRGRQARRWWSCSHLSRRQRRRLRSVLRRRRASRPRAPAREARPRMRVTDGSIRRDMLVPTSTTTGSASSITSLIGLCARSHRWWGRRRGARPTSATQANTRSNWSVRLTMGREMPGWTYWQWVLPTNWPSEMLMTCYVFFVMFTAKYGVSCKNKMFMWFHAKDAPTCGVTCNFLTF
jgi:hypothetical protein